MSPAPPRSPGDPLRAMSEDADDIVADAGRLRAAVAQADGAAPSALTAASIADAVVAVRRTRLVLAQALDAVGDVVGGDDDPTSPLGHARMAARRLVARTGSEVGHVFGDRPHSILIRVVITLATSLALVVFYRLTGWADYAERGSLSLYLFGAVIGSVVCTNALCFEADRVLGELADGERLWRILIAKNLTMGGLVTVAAAPVIALLAVTTDLETIAVIDQFVVMVLIWLGVGNLLSVISPLRHEPLGARLHDGTWRAYLLSFGISYGVGLTVNLMIYWRLWARESATERFGAPSWSLQLLMLASGTLIWILLSVLAVSSSRLPSVRQLLGREMLSRGTLPTTAD
ncbi:hypothetical protein GYA93_00185 [Gordonia desulfuricans]|uniref:Uncharacterized protein n=1 Tax=Gordonia desulfuricans TaxID=89051 RepID=A0A7K3LIB8_9ACTN|nr:hypothetical protein [Gordonia desulfuricans]NDK88005.1 hypothetical protein [Gordonia desulfuricans]